MTLPGDERMRAEAAALWNYVGPDQRGAFMGLVDWLVEEQMIEEETLLEGRKDVQR